MSLWVLSEATHWRLWFLSRTSALAMHHPSWCPTRQKDEEYICFFIFNLLCPLVFTNLVHICNHFLLIGPAYDCTSSTCCGLLWNSRGRVFFFQTMTLLEFAFKDKGPATRVTGSICTCQTRNCSFFPAPVFYWRFRSLSCSTFVSVPVHNPQPRRCRKKSITLEKPRALNENWWQISH